MSGRLARPISSTSRQPSVVTSAVCAPLRSVSALMTTVVPWTKCSTPVGSSPDLAIASMIPRAKPGGVDDALASPSSPVCLVEVDEVGERPADVGRQLHNRASP